MMSFKPTFVGSERLAKQLSTIVAEHSKHLEEKEKKLKQGDDLAPGILKIIKIYLGVKKISETIDSTIDSNQGLVYQALQYGKAWV